MAGSNQFFFVAKSRDGMGYNVIENIWVLLCDEFTDNVKYFFFVVIILGVLVLLVLINKAKSQ